MNCLRLIARACPVLALGAVLAVAGPTYARGGHGGGGHGGFHGGGFHGGGFRGGFGRGFGGGFNRGFGGFGYGGYRGYGFRRYGGYGGYGLGYYPYYYGYGYGYPNYYSSYYSYPYYPYYYSNGYTGTPAGGYQSYYPTASAAPAPNAVRLNIWVPVANAKVWIDNTATQQMGTYRQFESPPLTPGSNYSYTVKGQWTENGKTVERSQTVHFQAGQQLNVNLGAG